MKRNRVFAVLTSLLLTSTLFGQTPETLVLGELIFRVVNPGAFYNVTVNLSNEGMLFSGDSQTVCPQPKVYSHTYSNLDSYNNCTVKETQSITGAERTFSNNNGETIWYVEHVGDGVPEPLDDEGWDYEWIGNGLYKIQITGPDGTYTFYIDYLDSNYPSETDEFDDRIYPDVDIFIDYDFNRAANARVTLSGGTYTSISVDGKVFNVWDIFKPSEPRATEFFVSGNVPLSGLTSDELYTSVIVDGGVTVPSGKSFIIQPDLYPDENNLPDITLKMESSVGYVVNGTIEAVGTASNPVTFTSAESTPARKDWGTMFVFSSDNTFKHCVFEYGDWGLKIHGNPSATDGNLVENCTFRENDQGLRIHNSTVTVDNCLLEDNRHAYVVLDNALVTILENLVQDNDRDGIYTGASVLNVFDSRFENNGLGEVSSHHGIYALSGADIALGLRVFIFDPDVAGGFNTVRNNRGAGILTVANSVVLAGNVGSFFGTTTYIAGNNSLHDNGAASGFYSGKDFFNEDTATMQAKNNYWGGSCPPAASQIYGSVATDYCQTSSPTGYSIDLTHAEHPEFPTFAGSQNTGKQNSVLSQDPDTQIKLSIIQQNKQLIASQPNSRSAVEALKGMYSFIRTDLNNKLGQKSSIYGYLNGLYTSYVNLALGQTALQLMIIDKRLNDDLSGAISLSKTARGVLSGQEKAGAMFNLVFMHLQDGDLKSAQQLVEDFKSEFPKNVAEIEILEGELANAGSLPSLNGQFSSAPENLQSQHAGKFVESLQFNPQLEARAYPNPFNPSTIIGYSISNASHVTLTVYDIRGREIATLVEGFRNSGSHEVNFDGSGLASGFYIYKLEAAGAVKVGRMLLMK